MDCVYQKPRKNAKRNRIPKPPVDFKPLLLRLGSFDGALHCIDGVRFHTLEKEHVLTLNDGNILPCYGNSHGYICILKMTNSDIIYLNSLTYQLVEQQQGLTSGHIHYLRHSYGLDDYSSEFFAIDRDTKVFNAMAIPIMKTSIVRSFQGKVAIAVKGLRVVDDFHIYLNAVIRQVKVEQEDDVIDAVLDECMFD